MSAKMNIIKELEKEMYLFNIGEHLESYRFLGSKKRTENGIEGWRFTVWAPNAKNVSLVGDFTEWEPVEMQKVG
ncbi:MAG TPA: 1,4-alpha-glucan branching enzyme, partial [Trichococcus sp.]|nr:1,4-alpha-glucan branching enzyme [Trichococcus sp.]